MHRLVHAVYDRTLRRWLPKRYGVLNGVAVRNQGILDRQFVIPDYKARLIDAVHEVVEAGDEVVIVALGRGVSTVHALWAGADHVTAIEGAESMLALGQDTLRAMKLADDVSIVHAVVGESPAMYGPAGEADAIEPAELETGDVLVLDCEGAERSILEGLDDEPSRIACETHPDYGTDDDLIGSILRERGYAVEVWDYKPHDETSQKHILIGRQTE